MSDLHYTPSIRKSSKCFANTDALEANNASPITSGSFYVGIDLENYVAAPKNTIFAGWNSNTDDIYFIGNYNTNTSVAPNYNLNFTFPNVALPTATIRYDAYAHYDSLIIFDRGTAYVQY
jgi:hypothetical protein